MKELNPCLENDSGAAQNCSSHMEREVKDVRTFQDILASFFNSTEDGGPRASSVLVALHNVVTSTVPLKFKPDRHRYYCAAEVLEKLTASDVLRDGSLQFGSDAVFSKPFLGLGPHHLRNCSARG